VLPPNKTRKLFFDSEQIFNECKDRLMQVMGHSNVFDFYEVGSTLSTKNFAEVKLATRKTQIPGEVTE